MFAQLHSTSPRRRNALLYGSVGLHCLLLYLVVRSSGPIFVAPSSVVRGVPRGRFAHFAGWVLGGSDRRQGNHLGKTLAHVPEKVQGGQPHSR